MSETEGTIDGKEDIEKGEDGVVKRWKMEIDKAGETEKAWRKDARKALGLYRLEEHNNDDFAKRKETFNILWSNTETIRPVLYNSEPRPDIRRRWKDKDPLGKAVSEVCERSVTFNIDAQDLDKSMIAAVNDSLLPGRAITRLRYVPSYGPEEMDENNEVIADEEGEPIKEVAYEEVTYEQIQYDDFRRGAGRTWDEVTWIAFRHKLTKEAFKEQFPGFVDLVKFDATVYDDASEKEQTEPDKQIFKRALVWEVWDKDTKKVIFFAPSYKDKALVTKPDPLELVDFWPIPRPMYAIENSTTLIPSTKYSMYETLATELENVTNRIRKVMDGLRLRGIYDARIPEIEKTFDSFDNTFVPAENIAALLDSGGLDKAIWTLPIQMYAEVLKYLYEYRQGLTHGIYEITGISDVIRGDTNPNETLGAQEIKANFGSQRLQREQREVQRYARDIIRLTVEIICENFQTQTLELMTGLNFPTNQMKQQAQAQMQMRQQQAQQQHQHSTMQAQQQGQMAAQQAQMQGQPPPPPPQVPEFQPPQPDPNMIEMMQTPSWEDIREVMGDDMSRTYKIDIETDSTIQAEQQKDQKAITELLSGITNFFQGVAEPIASGVLTVETAKTMLMAAVRRFKLGREVEDALEDIEAPQQAQGVPQEQVDEQMQQVQQQAEQKIQQVTQQSKEQAGQVQQQAKQEAQMAGKQASEAIAKAKEAEQMAAQRAADAESKFKEMLAEIQAKAAQELAAEKARNQIAEKTQKLDFKQEVFSLNQQLDATKKGYDETLMTLKNTVVDCQHSATTETHAKAERVASGEKATQAVDKSAGMFTKALSAITDAMSGEAKSREETAKQLVGELNKPRTLVRDSDDKITGIE